MKIFNLAEIFALLPLIAGSLTEPTGKLEQDIKQKFEDLLKTYPTTDKEKQKTWASELNNLELHPKELEKLVAKAVEDDTPKVEAAKFYVNLAFINEIAAKAYNAEYIRSVIEKFLEEQKHRTESNIKTENQGSLEFIGLSSETKFPTYIAGLNSSKVSSGLEPFLNATMTNFALKLGKENNLAKLFESHNIYQSKSEKDATDIKNFFKSYQCPIFTPKTLLLPDENIKSEVSKCPKEIEKLESVLGSTYPAEYLLGAAYLEAKKAKNDKEAHAAQVNSVILMSQVMTKFSDHSSPFIDKVYASESFVKYYRKKLEACEKTSKEICSGDIAIAPTIKITQEECKSAINAGKEIIKKYDKDRTGLYFEQASDEETKVDKDYIKTLAENAKKSYETVKGNDIIHYAKLEVNRYYMCVHNTPDADCWMYLCAASLYQSDLHDVTSLMCYQNLSDLDADYLYKISGVLGTSRLSVVSSTEFALEKQRQEKEYSKDLITSIKAPNQETK